MNNKIKISIKSRGLKIKTTDVEVAIDALVKISNNGLNECNCGQCNCNEPTNEELEHLDALLDGFLQQDAEIKKAEKKEKKKRKEYKRKSIILDTKRKGCTVNSWTEAQLQAVRDGIAAGKTNTEIAKNAFLLKSHTPGSIHNRTSRIRNGRK